MAGTYGYVDSATSRVVVPFLIASGLAVAGVAASWPWFRRLSNDDRGGVGSVQEWALILSWCLLASVIQGVLRSLTPHSLEAMFASDMANSFYSVAVKFDVASILGDFERLRHSWALHAQSNLPGKLLLVRALIDSISARPDALAWAIVVLSNLGGVLLYIFVRGVFADRFIAALSAVLYLFTPAKFYFFPLLNTVTPVVVFACACLLLQWLKTGRTIYAALLGLAIYGLILFEPTALVAGVLFGVLLVHTIVTRRMALLPAVLQIGVGVLAFAATYFVMNLWFGFDLLSAFRSVAADAVAFNETARRPYGIWVRQNIVDFLFGVGLCQIVLFLAALADGVARSKSDQRSPGTVSNRARMCGDCCDGRSRRRHRCEQGRGEPPLDFPRVLLGNPSGLYLPPARKLHGLYVGARHHAASERAGYGDGGVCCAMMPIVNAALTLVALVLALGAHLAGQRVDAPPMPFVDEGACPFEGCLYRDWRAKTSVAVYDSWDRRAPVRRVFSVKAGEMVTAMTGVVVTTAAGRAVIRRAMVGVAQSKYFPYERAVEIPLKAGDTVYLLTNQGEGFHTAWFNQMIFTLDRSQFSGLTPIRPARQTTPATEKSSNTPRLSGGRRCATRAERSDGRCRLATSKHDDQGYNSGATASRRSESRNSEPDARHHHVRRDRLWVVDRAERGCRPDRRLHEPAQRTQVSVDVASSRGGADREHHDEGTAVH